MAETVDLSFLDLMESEIIPQLKKAFADRGITDLELQYSDLKLKGNWRNSLRQFIVFFAKEDLNGQKAFTCSDGRSEPSTFEPFLGDERKVGVELMIFALIQRLNGQKWLLPN